MFDGDAAVYGLRYGVSNQMIIIIITLVYRVWNRKLHSIKWYVVGERMERRRNEQCDGRGSESARERKKERKREIVRERKKERQRRDRARKQLCLYLDKSVFICSISCDAIKNTRSGSARV